MARYIENLNECTDPTTGDYLWVVDASAGSTDKDRKLNVGKFAQLTDGTWTPAITGSSSNPTISYTTQTGRYSRIGDIVFFDAYILIDTISGGSGDVRVSLPVVSATGLNIPGNVHARGVDFAGSPIDVVCLVPTGSLFAVIDSVQDNATYARLQISGLAAGDDFSISGFYFA